MTRQQQVVEAARTVRYSIEQGMRARPVTTLYLTTWIGVMAFLETSGMKLW